MTIVLAASSRLLLPCRPYRLQTSTGYASRHWNNIRSSISLVLRFLCGELKNASDPEEREQITCNNSPNACASQRLGHKSPSMASYPLIRRTAGHWTADRSSVWLIANTLNTYFWPEFSFSKLTSKGTTYWIAFCRCCWMVSRKCERSSSCGNINPVTELWW